MNLHHSMCDDDDDRIGYLNALVLALRFDCVVIAIAVHVHVASDDYCS